MRCFLAVPVLEPTRGEVEALLRRLRPRLPDARVVSSSNLHLTLHFFEDLSPSQVDSVDQRSRPACWSTPAFDIGLSGLGTFPERGRPRVLWVGLGEGLDRLAALQAAIGRVLAEGGLPVESRPFHPHLTLARFRVGSAPPDLPAAPGSFSRFRVPEVLFVRSLLEPSGAVHEILHRYPLTS